MSARTPKVRPLCWSITLKVCNEVASPVPVSKASMYSISGGITNSKPQLWQESVNWRRSWSTRQASSGSNSSTPSGNCQVADWSVIAQELSARKWLSERPLSYWTSRSIAVDRSAYSRSFAHKTYTNRGWWLATAPQTPVLARWQRARCTPGTTARRLAPDCPVPNWSIWKTQNRVAAASRHYHHWRRSDRPAHSPPLESESHGRWPHVL